MHVNICVCVVWKVNVKTVFGEVLSGSHISDNTVQVFIWLVYYILIVIRKCVSCEAYSCYADTYSVCARVHVCL